MPDILRPAPLLMALIRAIRLVFFSYFRMAFSLLSWQKVAMLPLVVACSGALFIGAAARAGQMVVNPRVTTDSSIDTSSADTAVKQIIKAGMSDEEKALACWRFMLDHFYHWHPPQEVDVPSDVRDFAKTVNSYGYGPCFVNAPVLSALWEAAGFETRSSNLSGHTVPEVKYNGTWHMFDGDARAWHRKADGEIASVEDLANDASLFINPAGKSEPYYPFAAPDVVAAPLEPWSSPSRMVDLYLSRDNNYVYNRRAVVGHPMYLTLREGESITLFAGNKGKWNMSGKWYTRRNSTRSEAISFMKGPVDISGALTYGNGELSWRTSFRGNDVGDSLWLGSRNVKAGAHGLMREKTDEPGIAIFRVWCPYVLVGGKIEGEVAVGSGRLPSFEISTDGGYVWKTLSDIQWSKGSKADLRFFAADVGMQVAGKYEYLVRVKLEDEPLSWIDFMSTFQLAPLSLPRLRPGKNKIAIFRGPDEGHVQLVLGEKQVAKERYISDKGGSLMLPERVAPKNFGESGFVVYKLTAPQALTGISVGANVNLDTSKGQYVEASYSLDHGKTWSPIWKLANNNNSRDSQFEVDRKVTFDNPSMGKEALVRFSLMRNSPIFFINGVRLYAFYRQPQPEGAKLAVEIVWKEKLGEAWHEQKRSVVVTKFPHEFELICNGENVRLQLISLNTVQ